MKTLSRQFKITDQDGSILIQGESALFELRSKIVQKGLLENLLNGPGPVIASGMYVMYVGEIREIKLEKK